MALNRVKWSGVGQSKITKGSFLAGSGRNGLTYNIVFWKIK